MGKGRGWEGKGCEWLLSVLRGRRFEVLEVVDLDFCGRCDGMKRNNGSEDESDFNMDYQGVAVSDDRQCVITFASWESHNQTTASSKQAQMFTCIV